MTENLDILDATVSLFVKAALPAARFSGIVRKRSLRRLDAIGCVPYSKRLANHGGQ